MTPDDPQVKVIADRGLTPYLSRRERFERVILYVAIGLGLLGAGGVVVDKIATNNVAACTNANLGGRNSLTSQEAVKASAFASSLADVLAAPQAQKAAVYDKDFLPALSAYQQVLAHNNAYRAAHPLGKC